jgi:hypothetical protein
MQVAVEHDGAPAAERPLAAALTEDQQDVRTVVRQRALAWPHVNQSRIRAVSR